MSQFVGDRWHHQPRVGDVLERFVAVDDLDLVEYDRLCVEYVLVASVVSRSTAVDRTVAAENVDLVKDGLLVEEREVLLEVELIEYGLDRRAEAVLFVGAATRLDLTRSRALTWRCRLAFGTCRNINVTINLALFCKTNFFFDISQYPVGWAAQSSVYFSPWQTCSFRDQHDIFGKKSAMLLLMSNEYSLTFPLHHCLWPGTHLYS